MAFNFINVIDSEFKVYLIGYKKQFMKVKKKLSINTLIAIPAALVAIIITVCVAYLSHTHFKQTFLSHTQQQLLTIAKSTAKSVEEFVAEYSRDLVSLSRNPSIQEELYEKLLHVKHDVGYCMLKDLYEIHKDKVDALTTLDTDGIMLHRHPFLTDRPGRDHSDKPGVAYVLKEHKPNVSEVFFNNLSNPAISISEPVFYKEKFAGMIRWMIQVDTISRRFIMPVSVGEKGHAVLLDEKGRFLYHPKRIFGGETFYDLLAEMKKVLPDHDMQGLIKRAADQFKGKEGVGMVYCLMPKERGDNERIKKIIGYAPVHVGNKTWSISVNLPYSEIAGPIDRHARNTFGFAGIIILLFGAGGIAFFRTKKKKAELETEARYLEKAQINLEQKVEERTRELREVQEAIIRNERLAALGQLAGSVGHEIRNPLGIIKNAGYFLNMKIETIEDELVKENINIINRETDIAAKIVSDLLDFARIKEPERKKTDINELIRETLKRSLVADRVTVVTNFADNISPVSIDPLQVGQVFLNLIENGIQAMKKGGTLRISTRVTEKATDVVFIDNGCGIPKKNLDKIFEPLFTTKTRGIGLGLSISKSLANANGADILVDSEEGAGSKFVVRFEDLGMNPTDN